MEFSDSGILSKVVLWNFLCHDRLDLQLGPNVNFIHGNNGSGKSAILLGICVCIGAKASDTLRASSLKDLIQIGKDEAKVEVTLLNGKSPDSNRAFRYDMFGSEITIQRVLRRSGNNHYRIFDENRNTVSEKLQTVREILAFFNIQPGNPCVVLNQENAREFLKSNNSKVKYEYFRRASLLKDMEDELDETAALLGQLRRSVEDHQARVSQLEEERGKAEGRLELAQGLMEMELRHQEMRMEWFWAVVNQKKELVRRIEIRKSEIEKDLEQTESKLDNMNQNKQNMLRDKSKIEAELEAQELAKLAKEVRELKNQIQEREYEFRKLAERRRIIGGRKGQHQNSLNRLETELEERQSRSLDSTETLEMYHKELQNAKDKVEELQQDNLSVLEGDLRGFRQELGEIERGIQVARSTARRSSMEKNSLQRELKQIDNGRQNVLLKFGSRTADINRRISQLSGQFSETPLGPLGIYVSVTEEQWALAVEHCLTTGLMRSYLVNNFDDMRLLNRIFDELRCAQRDKPTVIVMKKSDRPYNPNLPPRHIRDLFPHVPTILDKISIEVPWVFNLLINRSSPERCFIVDTKRRAADMVATVRKNREASHFLSKVFTIDGDAIVLRRGFPATEPRKTDVCSLAKNYGEQIKRINMKIHQCEMEERQHQENIQHFERERSQKQQDIRNINTKCSQLQNEINRATKNVYQLEEKIETIDGDFDTSDIIQEMREVKQKLKDLQVEQARFDEEGQNIRSILSNLHMELEGKKRIIDNVANSMQCLQKKCDQMNQSIDELNLNIQQLQNQTMIQRRRLVKVEEAIKIQRNDFEQCHLKAMAACDPVDTEADPDALMSEIELFRVRMSAEKEQLRGNFDDIQQHYQNAITRFEHARVQYEHSANNFEGLNSTYENRKVAFSKFQRMITRKLKMTFFENLTSQGFSGMLHFNHDERTLEIEFDRGENSASKNTKSLSGGERSFSTLCFVFSIAAVIQSPFVALDEFDVFMVRNGMKVYVLNSVQDPVNRSISTDLLMKFGTSNPEKQFVLITPNDLSMIEARPPQIVIHTLEAPKRGT